jgi:hypothetical protein
MLVAQRVAQAIVDVSPRERRNARHNDEFGFF